MTVLSQDLRDAALLALLDREEQPPPRGISMLPMRAGQLWNAMRPYSHRVGYKIDPSYPFELKQMKQDGLIQSRRRKIKTNCWGEIDWRIGWVLTENGRQAALELRKRREP